MRNYFAYIRVSTAKQGERGVSLQEQRSAILSYATHHGLQISQWFEERETAAKRGRPVFSQMLRLLQRDKARGVIIHKIDRSARNLRDWADLGELIDAGHEVHFANESLDLTSRGGRLSADIQAVVAADYIRNLREETRKGFYGRLRQGLYPLPAPIGYLDRGGGHPKVPNPETAPMVKKLFELYATGRYSIPKLTVEANRLGLRTRVGKPITKTPIHHILINPFFMGVMRVRSTNELFQGVHEPIVSKSLFDNVQAVLTGKRVCGTQAHDYVFRRLLTCKLCGYSLIGERQKGHIYYRCHSRGCPTATVREEAADAEMLRLLAPLQFSTEEQVLIDMRLADLKLNWKTERTKQLNRLQLQLAGVREKQVKLTDAYIEGRLDKELFEMRHNGLLLEKKGLEETVSLIGSDQLDIHGRAEKFLELCSGSYLSYRSAGLEGKREIVQNTTSNRLVEGKRLDFSLSIPFRQVAEREKAPIGCPSRDIPRTLAPVFAVIGKFYAEGGELAIAP